MIMDLNLISTKQTKSTNITVATIIHLLDYAIPLPDAFLIYYARELVLQVHSDAFYISKPEAKIRPG